MQNVSTIRSSKDLNNKFQLYAALSLASNNQQVNIYTAQGQIASFNDFSNDSKIDYCVKTSKCLYRIALELAVDSDGRNLVLSVVYNDAKGYNDEVVIESVNLYYQDQIIRKVLDPAISLTGIAVIPINLSSVNLIEINAV